MTVLQRLTALAQHVDRAVGWHRLPAPLGVAVLAGLRQQLRSHNLYDTGRSPNPTTCDSLTADGADFMTARTINGTHNDLRDPAMGAIGNRFGRNVAPELTYPEPPDHLLSPNPRLVSRQLLTRDTFKPANTLNVLAAAWIQFEVHDWFSHDTDTADPWKLRLQPDDPWPHPTMDIARTAPDPDPDPAGPPTFITTDTHWWDGSQIYGSNRQFADGLRSGHNGMLGLDAHGLHPERLEDFLSARGGKNNFWIGLALLHSLFLREHNAICAELACAYPQMTDQQLYDIARLINVALMAKIHTVEWTPAIINHPTTRIAMHANWFGLLGAQFHDRYGRLTANEELDGIPGSPTSFHGVPYALTEEFVAVYRMHPLIPDEYVIRSLHDNRVLDTCELPDLVVPHVRTRLDQVAMADLFYSLGTAHPGAITLHNFPRHLQYFDRRPRDTEIDLAATDILRTRERGVPRYNAFRRALGLKPAESFDQLTDDAVWAQQLRQIYGDVEDVDLMIGLYAEPKPPGFGFSDTAFRIFILMASRRLECDRFFTRDFRPEIYTQVGMDWISANSLHSILIRHHPELRSALSGVANPFFPWQQARPPQLVAKPATRTAPQRDVSSPYLRYTSDLDQSPPGEDADIARTVARLHRTNERVYRRYGHALRDAHAKSHAILRGELTVYGDLPTELRQGLFASPGTFAVISRLSSTAGLIRSDQLRGVHGMAIKVLGVEGPRILTDDENTTQDFLLVTHKEFPFKDASEYLRRGMPLAGLLSELSDPALALAIHGIRIAQSAAGLVHKSLPLPMRVFTAPNTNMLGMEFYSAAPVRWGDYVAKFQVVPLSDNVRSLTAVPLSPMSGPDAYREMMVDFYATQAAEYELQAQLCTDLATMPIEDATVEWPEASSPYRPVAKLSYPVQNPYTDARQYFGDEVLSYNSWRGLELHRPLGPINRMKLKAYDASSHYRHEKNQAPSYEPTVEQLPH